MASANPASSSGAATTSNPSPATFACPDCGATYKWKPELAGRRIRCKHCPTTFAATLPPGTGAAVDPRADAVAALAARSGFAVPARRSPREMAAEEDELTVVQNWILPVATLVLGLAIRLWQAFGHAARFDSVSAAESVGLVLVEWLAVSVAVAGGVLVSATFIDIDLDKPGRGALKVVATAILMCAVAQFCSSFDRSAGDLYGMTLGVPCVLLLAFFMLAAMFGVDLLEALMGTVAVTIFAAGAMIALAAIVQGESGVVLAFRRPAV